MSNSPLVSYTKISPNSNNPRKNKIQKITIHHMAGNLSVETCGNVFASKSRQASSNYGVGSDGRIGMYVEEKNRSWCSSNAENDHQAITIEVANDGGAPNWHVSDKALAATIDLCTDICQRNGIHRLNYTGDKNGNLTEHNYFAATACPGPYLKSKLPYIAQEVNKRLVSDSIPDSNPSNNASPTPDTNVNIPAVPFTVNVIVSDLNYRSAPSMEGAVRGQTGKGIFTIVEVSEGWGKLKSGAGWIWLGNPSYLKIQGTVASSAPAAFEPYTVKVNPDVTSIWIRKGPGTNYGTNGTIQKGVYTIVEESSGTGSTKGWGKLKSGAGWISLDFVTKT